MAEGRVGVRKTESVRETGQSARQGPSPGQGWPHTLPLGPCCEAQGTAPWQKLDHLQWAGGADKAPLTRGARGVPLGG